METTILVWSAAARSREQGVGGGVHLAHVDPSAAAPPPRPAKAKKKPAGPKKPPQRGLGVEALERLRLQEQWKKMAHVEPPTLELIPHFAQHRGDRDVEMVFPFRVPHQQARGLSLVGFAVAPDGCGGAWGESCCLQKHGEPGAAGGLLANATSAAFSGAAASALPDDAGVSRCGIAMAEGNFLQVGNGALTEFPSSQSLLCSEQCDLCVRKKRVLEENFGINAGGNDVYREGRRTLNLLGECWSTAASAEEMAAARRTTKAAEVKEYVLFPCSIGGSGGSNSELGSDWDRWTAAGDSPASSSCARSGKQLDLSLKLSF